MFVTFDSNIYHHLAHKNWIYWFKLTMLSLISVVLLFVYFCCYYNCSLYLSDIYKMYTSTSYFVAIMILNVVTIDVSDDLDVLFLKCNSAYKLCQLQYWIHNLSVAIVHTCNRRTCNKSVLAEIAHKS